MGSRLTPRLRSGCPERGRDATESKGRAHGVWRREAARRVRGCPWREVRAGPDRASAVRVLSRRTPPFAAERCSGRRPPRRAGAGCLARPATGGKRLGVSSQTRSQAVGPSGVERDHARGSDRATPAASGRQGPESGFAAQPPGVRRAGRPHRADAAAGGSRGMAAGVAAYCLPCDSLRPSTGSGRPEFIEGRSLKASCQPRGAGSAMSPSPTARAQGLGTAR